jgi:hypothetical protein
MFAIKFGAEPWQGRMGWLTLFFTELLLTGRHCETVTPENNV